MQYMTLSTAALLFLSLLTLHKRQNCSDQMKSRIALFIQNGGVFSTVEHVCMTMVGNWRKLWLNFTYINITFIFQRKFVSKHTTDFASKRLTSVSIHLCHRVDYGPRIFGCSDFILADFPLSFQHMKSTCYFVNNKQVLLINLIYHVPNGHIISLVVGTDMELQRYMCNRPKVYINNAKHDGNMVRSMDFLEFQLTLT